MSQWTYENREVLLKYLCKWHNVMLTRPFVQLSDDDDDDVDVLHNDSVHLCSYNMNNFQSFQATLSIDDNLLYCQPPYS